MSGLGMQEILNLALTLLGIVAPFIAKVIFDKIKDAKAEAMKTAEEGKALAIEALRRYNELRIMVAEEYVSNGRFEGFEKTLFQKLDRIELKLDQKVDKP
jgi:hypothetical protein